jgi:DNA-directed RNA polymerase specialized sigma24 family protein
MNDIDPVKLERVQRAFDRLPSIHAEIFSAVRHDDLSYAEIGKRTGLSPWQVKRIFADALYRLAHDVWEQEHGIAIGPIWRFLRERRLNLRLQLHLWRERF